jgi:hypothetical protein
VTLLAGAFEIFSDAIDAGATPSVADRYQRSYRSFQRAVAAGDDRAALAIANGELSSVISGIPRASWPRIKKGIDAIAIRTGVLSDSRDSVVRAEELLRSPALGWRPEIIVKAGSPAERVMVRAAIRKAMADALTISVAGTEKKGALWSERVFESGLLHAPAVEVEIADDERLKGATLSVKWGRTKGGLPSIKLGYSQEEDLFDWGLIYAIMSSCNHSKHHWVNLRGKAEDSKKIGVSNNRYFDMCTAGELRPGWIDAAMKVQSRLLGGDYHEDLSRALARLPMGSEAIEKVLDETDRTLFGITVSEVPSDEKVSFSADVRHDLPLTKFREGLRRSRPFVHLRLGIPTDMLERVTEEALWMLVGRTFALWLSNGKPESLSDDIEGIDEPIERAVYSRADTSLNLSTNLPSSWSDEFFAIMDLLNGFSRRGGEEGLSRHPEIQEVVSLLREMIPVKKIGYDGHLDTVQIVHQESGHAIWPLPRYSKGEVHGLTIKIDMDVLGNLFTPMQMAQIVLAAYLSGQLGAGVCLPMDSAIHASTQAAYLNESREWLRLMWEYSKTVGEDRGAGMLDLRGDGAEPLSDEIVNAIERLNMTDPDMLANSLTENGIWVIEYPKGNVNAKHVSRASRLTIAALPSAKLIHFNGPPDLDVDEWVRVVRAIALAPQGATWVDILGAWRSNRPDLILADGDDGWYSLNEHYADATPTGKREYADALDEIRILHRRYSDAIGLPLLEPGSSRAEMKRLMEKMLTLFHPDRAVNSDFIDIGGEEQRDFIAAFQVLQRFYE